MPGLEFAPGARVHIMGVNPPSAVVLDASHSSQAVNYGSAHERAADRRWRAAPTLLRSNLAALHGAAAARIAKYSEARTMNSGAFENVSIRQSSGIRRQACQ